MTVLRAFIAFLSLVGGPFLFAGTPTYTASVEEPVVPELMGGCSMKCGFPWTLQLFQNGKGESSKALSDESPETAWTTELLHGFPEIRIAFPKKLPPEMSGNTPFYGMDFINGAWKNEDQWRQHGRIKRLRFNYNGKPIAFFALADSRRWQRVTFPDIMVRSGDTLSLEVVEIYPGKKPGIALSEIVLQGAH